MVQNEGSLADRKNNMIEKIGDFKLIDSAFPAIGAKLKLFWGHPEFNTLIEREMPDRWKVFDDLHRIYQEHDDAAREISLGGDFNDWQPDEIRLKKQANGFWQTAIEILPPGKYRYKFAVDGTRWTDDATST